MTNLPTKKAAQAIAAMFNAKLAERYGTCACRNKSSVLIKIEVWQEEGHVEDCCDTCLPNRVESGWTKIT